MQRTRKLALVVLTVSVAVGAGYLVQNKKGAPPTVAATAPELGATPKSVVQLSATEETTQITPPVQAESAPALAMLPTPEIAVPAAPAAPIPAPAMAEDSLPAAPGAAMAAQDCPLTLDLSLQDNAMIGLTLTAPCRPDQRVVMRHAGLAVTERTSATGSLFLSLPALETNAQVSVLFGDGQSADATIDVPDVAALHRFGVQWLADDAFQVNAFENGADYGQPGHVSAATPQTPTLGAPPRGGYLTVLGDASVDLPMQAQVYTFPAKDPADVVVEAAVTPATCGRELLGETLSSLSGAVTLGELTLAMPDCDAVGDFLVLKNLAADPKIVASN